MSMWYRVWIMEHINWHMYVPELCHVWFICMTWWDMDMPYMDMTWCHISMILYTIYKVRCFVMASYHHLEIQLIHCLAMWCIFSMLPKCVVNIIWGAIIQQGNHKLGIFDFLGIEIIRLEFGPLRSLCLRSFVVLDKGINSGHFGASTSSFSLYKCVGLIHWYFCCCHCFNGCKGFFQLFRVVPMPSCPFL